MQVTLFLPHEIRSRSIVRAPARRIKPFQVLRIFSRLLRAGTTPKEKSECRVAGRQVDFDNATSALLALASEGERISYERELAKPPQQDDYGEEIRDTSVQDTLLPRLTDKLRSGEWVASGFGFESGQPTEIHPRLWQRLAINVQMNAAYDSMANVSYKSATGSFHSLGFLAVEKTDAAGGLSARAKTIAEIIALFECLDGSLPLNAPKKCFFHEASEALSGSVPETWLRIGWKNAELQPARRRPGLKSN